jgi:hypothetical protein
VCLDVSIPPASWLVPYWRGASVGNRMGRSTARREAIAVVDRLGSRYR